jgi:hypothetical protein
MRHWLMAVVLVAGCTHARSYVRVDDVALGRIVVYRNGVAYYERHAQIAPGERALRVEVPADKVDDFLKSLTVVETATGKPLSVSFPHRDQAARGTVEMTVDLPAGAGAATDLTLTYITDAPSWKPSYRIEVQPDGKVLLQGWAVVDNTSGEDWNRVILGVGSSSAMSFRYDLWSIRAVDRRTLSGDQLFSEAPPVGGSPYRRQPEQKVVLTTIDTDFMKNIPVRGRTYEEVLGAAAGSQPDTYGTSFSGTTGDGAITGRVLDQTSGQPMLLVTVVATSPALGGRTVSEFTDESGTYRLDGLPEGTYTLTFVYGGATIRREDVAVVHGRAAVVMVKLNTQSTGELS